MPRETSCLAPSHFGQMQAYAFVCLVGLVAGAISGIVGTGSSIILMPILVFQFGPKEAVPIMAIAGLMANIGKVAAWWREVDWRACAAYAVPGALTAALGARTLLALDVRIVDISLGLFFLAMIPVHHWLEAHDRRIGLTALAVAGAAIGFITGIVISTAPLSVPAFGAYGLVKGAFISTEAASSLAIFASKATTFRAFGALPTSSILKGLLIGASLIAGAFLGKAVVQRLSVKTFRYVLDILLAVAGIALLIEAFRQA